jgi:16S rRNA (uracil1498-N3)-methyltransferase
LARAPIPALEPGERRLEGAVGHYLARVLRLRAGDSFRAFDPASGHEADAVIVRTGRDATEVRFGPLREGRTQALRSVTWIQGLAKGDKCDAVVRDATELGATRVIMAKTRRTVVKLDRLRADARQARWARIAEQAARQCGRSEAPIVDPPGTWEEVLARIGDEHSRFCLWERATEPLGPRLFEALAGEGPLAIACGAEGGLDDAEIAAARASGWMIASLGQFTLRTETVAGAVLGAVRVWDGMFDQG